MAAENWSQLNSKTFEQMVYFSTSEANYQTNFKLLNFITTLSLYYLDVYESDFDVQQTHL